MCLLVSSVVMVYLSGHIFACIHNDSARAYLLFNVTSLHSYCDLNLKSELPKCPLQRYLSALLNVFIIETMGFELGIMKISD